MTTEEAINLLEQICQKEALKKRGGGWLGVSAINEALEMAVAALRAQQAADDAIEGLCCDCVHGGPCCDYSENEGCEHHRADGSCWISPSPAKLDRSRWKGCEMCCTKYTKKDWNTENVAAHEFRVSGDSLMYCDQFYGWEGIRINFCPICGRPLTEEAWAELESRIGGNDGTTYEDTGLEPEEIENMKSLYFGGEHYVLGLLPPPNNP